MLSWYFVNAGVTEEEYMQISDEIRRNNRQSLMIFSIISSVFLLIMFFLSFVSQDVASNRWVYLFTMFITFAIYVIAKFCSDNYPVVLVIDVYAFMSVLFIFGIILGTFTRPDEQTVTFIALLLTVPLLFTDRPIRMTGCIYTYIIAFVIIAVKVKVNYVLAADVIDACVFGTISVIISTYMMSVKCQRYLYEKRVAILSEIDLLTGMRNRNSYEQNLNTYSLIYKNSISCIFVDVNGLHELNNTKGHEAGDRMLQFIAEKLQEQFGKKDTYRIGGDEFVAFVMDCSLNQLQKKIDIVVEAVEEETYHISIGYDTGFGSEMDMDTLIKNAEKRMYEAKKLFYQQKGIDRRVRL